MDTAPFEQSSIGSYPTKQAWDATATDLVATMLDRWHLTAAEAFVGGEAGSVLRVNTAAGESAVLKVGFPHVEAVWEAVGLETWAGLCPTVLRQDAWTWSMLLEEIRPGTRLDRSGLPAEEALEIGAVLYRRLIEYPAPAEVAPLSTIIKTYLVAAETRILEQREALLSLSVLETVEAALVDLRELADAGGDALLHGDYNPGNILFDAEHGWRVIDPKPMIGDPAFDLFPLIEQLGDPWRLPHPAVALSDGIERVAGIVGCDVARAARWCTGRAALNVTWFLDDGDTVAARRAAAELVLWAEVSGS